MENFNNCTKIVLVFKIILHITVSNHCYIFFEKKIYDKFSTEKYIHERRKQKKLKWGDSDETD